jgi:serine/threonine protein kinase
VEDILGQQQYDPAKYSTDTVDEQSDADLGPTAYFPAYIDVDFALFMDISTLRAKQAAETLYCLVLPYAESNLYEYLYNDHHINAVKEILNNNFSRDDGDSEDIFKDGQYSVDATISATENSIRPRESNNWSKPMTVRLSTFSYDGTEPAASTHQTNKSDDDNDMFLFSDPATGSTRHNSSHSLTNNIDDSDATTPAASGADRKKECNMKIVLIQTIQALGHIHDRGLIHGNVRLENIVLQAGRWKLIDLKHMCRSGVDNIDCARLNYCYAAPESLVVYEYQFDTNPIHATNGVYSFVDEVEDNHNSLDMLDRGGAKGRLPRNNLQSIRRSFDSSVDDSGYQALQRPSTFTVVLKSRVSSCDRSIDASEGGPADVLSPRGGHLVVNDDRNGVASAVEQTSGVETLLADCSFDVWSIGCVMYQLYSRGNVPLFCKDHSPRQHVTKSEWIGLDPSTIHWNDDSLWSVYYWQEIVKIQKLAFVPAATVDARSTAADPRILLLKQMLSRDPQQRPDVKRILAHKWFTGGLDRSNSGLREFPLSEMLTTYQLQVLASSTVLLAMNQQQMEVRGVPLRPEDNRLMEEPDDIEKVLFDVRCVGECPKYDVFISHRGSNDEALAAVIYRTLVSQGIRVWWAPRSLVRLSRSTYSDLTRSEVLDAYAEVNSLVNYGSVAGDGSVIGSVDGSAVTGDGSVSAANLDLARFRRLQCTAALANSAIYIPVISRLSLNHPSNPRYNLSYLHQDSEDIDDILLEYRMALELAAAGLVESIKPILVGDLIKRPGQSASFQSYFENDCCPLCIYEPVDVVEEELLYLLQSSYFKLGGPITNFQGVYSCIQRILSMECAHILVGKKEKAVDEMIRDIFSLVAAVDLRRQRRLLLEEFYGNICEPKVSTENFLMPKGHDFTTKTTAISPPSSFNKGRGTTKATQNRGFNSEVFFDVFASSSESMDVPQGSRGNGVQAFQSSGSPHQSAGMKDGHVLVNAKSPNADSKSGAVKNINKNLRVDVSSESSRTPNGYVKQAVTNGSACNKIVNCGDAALSTKERFPHMGSSSTTASMFSPQEVNQRLEQQLVLLQETSRLEREEFARRLESLEAQIRQTSAANDNRVAGGIVANKGDSTSSARPVPVGLGGKTDLMNNTRLGSSNRPILRDALVQAHNPATMLYDPFQLVEDSTNIYKQTSSRAVGCTNDVLLNIVNAVSNVLEFV